MRLWRHVSGKETEQGGKESAKAGGNRRRRAESNGERRYESVYLRVVRRRDVRSKNTLRRVRMPCVRARTRARAHHTTLV